MLGFLHLASLFWPFPVDGGISVERLALFGGLLLCSLRAQ